MEGGRAVVAGNDPDVARLHLPVVLQRGEVDCASGGCWMGGRFVLLPREGLLD